MDSLRNAGVVMKKILLAITLLFSLAGVCNSTQIMRGSTDTYTFRSSAGSNSATVSKPAGAAEGDLLVFNVFTSDDAAITPPSGVTQDYTKTSTTLAFFTLSKVVGASYPASYTFTDYTGTYIGVHVLCYQVAGGTPSFDKGATNLATSTADSATIAANTLTTEANNELVIYFMVPSDAVTWTSPAGVTERLDYDTMASADEIQATAGETTARTFTRSLSGTAWRGVTTVAYK